MHNGVLVMLVYTVLVPCSRGCPPFVVRDKVKRTGWRDVQVLYMQVRGSKEVFRPGEEPRKRSTFIQQPYGSYGLFLSHVILIIFRYLVNYCPLQLTALNCNATVESKKSKM